MVVSDLEYENSDLRQERSNAKFSTEELAVVIWNGIDRVKRRREITAYVNAHSDLHAPKPILFMNREERLENASRLVIFSLTFFFRVLNLKRELLC